jgi:hypothetical protein
MGKKNKISGGHRKVIRGLVSYAIAIQEGITDHCKGTEMRQGKKLRKRGLRVNGRSLNLHAKDKEFPGLASLCADFNVFI